MSKSNPKVLWYYLTSLWDWFTEKTRASFSTNQIQTKTNCDLVARVFPRFTQFADFYFEFSLANVDIDLHCDWPYDNFGFGFTTINRKAHYFLN